MPTIKLATASIHHVEKGSGLPLVLVHGTGVSADAWEKVMPDLSKRFRVIAYDRRAHHRSSGTASSRDYYAEHGRDLLGLIEALGASPSTVLAWSAGSFAALHAALVDPSKIRQLLLYEPPYHAKKHITWPLLKTFAVIGMNEALGRKDQAAWTFRRMVMAYAHGGSTLEKMTGEQQAVLQQHNLALLAELKAGTGEELTAAMLRSLKLPVTLVRGTQTPRLFADAFIRLQTLFPSAPAASIPEANHFAHFDDPATFVSTVFATTAINQ